jgi:hypothetical protein
MAVQILCARLTLELCAEPDGLSRAELVWLREHFVHDASLVRAGSPRGQAIERGLRLVDALLMRATLRPAR